MSMKYLYIMTLTLLLFSCKENERMVYELPGKVYFADLTATKDSINISLLSREEVSTTYLMVKLLGRVLKTPENFKMEVIPELTTAVEGLHYKALEESYTFSTDTIGTRVPIVIYKKDPELDKKNVVLALRLTNGADLTPAYDTRVAIRLKISNMVRVPEAGGYYSDLAAFERLFGHYSSAKHLMIIEIVGHDFWDGDHNSINNESGYYTPFARVLYQKIITGKYYDENGDLMEPWNVP